MATARDASSRFRTVTSGDRLGRYRVGQELGQGGMASVYRAFDTELRREVAIKVLFPHLCKRPDVVARFHREARAMAALDHRHILRIFDVGGGSPAAEAGTQAADIGADALDTDDAGHGIRSDQDSVPDSGAGPEGGPTLDPP